MNFRGNEADRVALKLPIRLLPFEPVSEHHILSLIGARLRAAIGASIWITQNLPTL
jgi:hypothetical protein